MPELAELAGPDVLSDVLRILRLQSRVFCRAEFGAPWSIAFPPGSAHFHLVERGTCWILTDDAPQVTRVSAGDLVLLPRGTGHRLSDTPNGGLCHWRALWGKNTVTACPCCNMAVAER